MCSQMELENFTKSFKIVFQKSPKMTKNVETFFCEIFEKKLNYQFQSSNRSRMKDTKILHSIVKLDFSNVRADT